MDKGLQAYNQISNEVPVEEADAHKLIQLLMSGALERLGKALAAIKVNNIEVRSEMIGNSIAIFIGLHDSLDFEKGGEIAQNLSGLYNYMIRRCTEANIENNAAYVEEVMKLLAEIKSAWDAIREQAQARPQGNTP